MSKKRNKAYKKILAWLAQVLTDLIVGIILLILSNYFD